MKTGSGSNEEPGRAELASEGSSTRTPDSSSTHVAKQPGGATQRVPCRRSRFCSGRPGAAQSPGRAERATQLD
jgi:hypothetical protein